MPAEVIKIDPKQKSSPTTILGMLLGHNEQIKHIAAVIIWENGDYQMVNDQMTLSEHAFATMVMQRALLKEMGD